MKTFIIQLNSEKLVSTDNMALVDALGYYKFLYGHRNDVEQYTYSLISDADELMYSTMHDKVPVGNIEFVQGFLNQFYSIKNIVPINIPEELNKEKFLKREVFLYTGKENLGDKELFVKSADRLKGICDIMQYSRIQELSERVAVSGVIDNIESEWRAFVHRGQLVGLQNYLGNFAVFPDVARINEMIAEYKDCPPSYTLDVAVCEQGTVLIEVHNFVSCGLYGFNEHKLLPLMLINGWIYLLKNS